jgi:sugar (pentulose or hexulose) kinase
MASSAPIGCDGVTSLIDIDGRLGENGADQRGVFAGLTRMTNRKTMLRAVLEGIAFSVKELADEMNWTLKDSSLRFRSDCHHPA